MVAVVTGAGGGLGRAHALALAARGAAVVVNDVGTSVVGEGRSTGTAEAVAEEIRVAGGEALAETSSVADDGGAEAIIEQALASFGRVDVVVNNAGIARPAALRATSSDDLRAEAGVHLIGTAHLLRAAWPALVQSGRGRIINTTSGVGLFGMAGAGGYAAAKMAVVGLTRTAALEGRRHGIHANAIAPIARTRMAGDVFGDLTPHLDPELVSAVVVWLAGAGCEVTGQVFSAGGGRVARIVVGVGPGIYDERLTAESLDERAEELLGDAALVIPADAMEEVALIRTWRDDDRGAGHQDAAASGRSAEGR